MQFLQTDLLEMIRQETASPASSVPLSVFKHPSPPGLQPKPSTSPQPSLLADIPPSPKKPSLREIPPQSEEKSSHAFKTISEAAQLLGVPTYVLRFWESQFSQIKPTKSRGGRRYYRPEDMEVLVSIKTLLYKEGYTIKGARKALSDLKRDIALAEVPVQVAQNSAKDTVKMHLAEKQRKQLAVIKEGLLGLKEQLSGYLPA